jgi:hypothetical protein
MSFDQGRSPGVLWQVKIYLLNDTNPQGKMKNKPLYNWIHCLAFSHLIKSKKVGANKELGARLIQ